MMKGTFLIAALAATVAIVGSAGVAVLATGDGSGDGEGFFTHHLHRLGQHLHGGHHHHDEMARLVDDLDLSPDQLRRFEKIHEIMAELGNGKHGAMAMLHGRFVDQLRSGRTDSGEIRRAVDDHVEQVRTSAYALTDEVVALLDSLDARQREIALEHFRQHESVSNGS